MANGGYLEQRATVAALVPPASIQTCSMNTQDTRATGNRYQSVVHRVYMVSLTDLVGIMNLSEKIQFWADSDFTTAVPGSGSIEKHCTVPEKKIWGHLSE